MSVVSYDIGGPEVREIDIGFKDERARFGFLHIPLQFTVHHEVKWQAAMRALALALDHQEFVT